MSEASEEILAPGLSRPFRKGQEGTLSFLASFWVKETNRSPGPIKGVDHAQPHLLLTENKEEYTQRVRGRAEASQQLDGRQPSPESSGRLRPYTQEVSSSKAHCNCRWLG